MRWSGFLILGSLATLYLLLAREAEGLAGWVWVCGVCFVLCALDCEPGEA
jgi:hypothetical protein